MQLLHLSHNSKSSSYKLYMHLHNEVDGLKWMAQTDDWSQSMEV